MTREELIAYDKWLTRRKWMTGEIISPEKVADLYLAEHPLPPADGAEEIFQKHRNEPYGIFRAMEEYATLHAQRLAEKMAEERLIEFGNMIRDEPNGDIPALADYFMRTINLKSKEQ